MRRRLSWLIIIAFVAGMLWVWEGTRESRRIEAVQQRIESIVAGVRSPDGSELVLAGNIERIEPALRVFVNDHVADDEAVSVVVQRGPAPATPDVDASHHAIITEPDGAWLKINVHCARDVSAIELLGYVRSE